MKNFTLNSLYLLLNVLLLISCNKKGYEAHFKLGNTKTTAHSQIAKKITENQLIAKSAVPLTSIKNSQIDNEVREQKVIENDEVLIASTERNSFIGLKQFSYREYQGYDKRDFQVETKAENNQKGFFHKLGNTFNRKLKNLETNYKLVKSLAETSNPETEGLGVAGFIAALVGLFVAGVLLGALAIVFGGISLGKISNNPDKYKGSGFAIAALIIGIIDIIGALIVLSAV